MAANKKKAPEPPVRKSFLIFGGVAIGAAVLGFVVMNFLGGGGGGEEETAELTTVESAEIPVASAPPSTEEATLNVAANELVPGGRDPFVPKVVASSEGGGASTTTSSSSGSTAVSQSAPAAAPPQAAPAYYPAPAQSAPQPQPAPQPAPQPQPQPAPQPQPQPGPAEPQPAPEKQRPPPPTQPVSVGVLSVYGGSADIRVADTIYEGARADDQLDARFKVLEVSGQCVTIKDRTPRDGSSRQRFEVCEGRQVER